jgi:hypothetical protein
MRCGECFFARYSGLSLSGNRSAAFNRTILISHPEKANRQRVGKQPTAPGKETV